MASRTKVIVSGGVGLALCLFLLAVSIPLHHLLQPALPPFFSQPIIAWGIFLFCLSLALLEIPLMVYGLRKVAEGASARTPAITLLGIGVFVFFPIIYALPNLLLTRRGLVWLGVIIAATSLLRFGSSIIFLPVTTTRKT